MKPIDTTAIEAAFLNQYRLDQMHGEVRTLDQYKDRYAGFESVIDRAYSSLSDLPTNKANPECIVKGARCGSSCR